MNTAAHSGSCWNGPKQFYAGDGALTDSAAYYRVGLRAQPLVACGSELAGLVVVAQVVFPRCSTAVLQVCRVRSLLCWFYGGQRPEVNSRAVCARRVGSRHTRTNGPSQPCTADAAQAPARVSAPTSW